MTPQQASELLDCPMCGCAATYVKHSAGVPGTQGFDKWDAVACKHCRTTVGACDRRFRNRADARTAWNRRAPAPTEPAVDRDAVLEEAAALFPQPHLEYFGSNIQEDIRALKSAHTNVVPDGQRVQMLHFLSDVTTAAGLLSHGKTDKGLAQRISDAAFQFRAALANPASPAVPELRLCATPDELKAHLAAVQAVPAPAPLAPISDVLFDGMAVYEEITRKLGKGHCHPHQTVSATLDAVVRLLRASQPTRAAYIPKPPPPRPQRPIGPAWTDAEREEYRKNMKRGERCLECSVIKGGGHFPGCPHGK